MASISNPITIEDFPETTEVLSSDKIIFFNSEGTPYFVQMFDLSNVLVLASELDSLSSKVEELETKYEEMEQNFNNTYVTSTQVAEKYSSVANFQEQSTLIEKTESFKDKLSNKADATYLEFQYNALKAKCQDMKKFLGSRDNWNVNGERGKGYKLLMAGKAIEGPSD